MLLVINLPLIGLWVSLLRVPYRLLYPAILLFCCIGLYSVNRLPADIYFMAGVRRRRRCSCSSSASRSTPLVLGFVLGDALEANFRRTLILVGRRLDDASCASPLAVALLAGRGAAVPSPCCRARDEAAPRSSRSPRHDDATTCVHRLPPPPEGARASCSARSSRRRPRTRPRSSACSASTSSSSTRSTRRSTATRSTSWCWPRAPPTSPASCASAIRARPTSSRCSTAAPSGILVPHVDSAAKARDDRRRLPLPRRPARLRQHDARRPVRRGYVRRPHGRPGRAGHLHRDDRGRRRARSRSTPSRRSRASTRSSSAAATSPRRSARRR